MKRSVIVALFFAGFLGGMVFVYSCGAGSGGSSAKAAAMNVGTPISSLPYAIGQSGLYYLTRNLSVASGNAITVTADHVTIDLMGFALSGDGASGYGVGMTGRRDVTVRNGSVHSFLSGVVETDGGNGYGHRVVGVRVWSNAANGIVLNGSGHLVRDSSAMENASLGIKVGTASTVLNNIASRNAGSDGIQAGRGSIVQGNTAAENGGRGITISQGTTVRGNTAYLNWYQGIFVNTDNTLDGNTAFDNDQSALGSPNINICSPCAVGTNHAP